LSLVFLNKALMGSMDFPYPLFVSFYQQSVAQICIVVFGWLGQRVKVYPITLFEPWEWDWSIARQILKLTLVTVAMISFNNICLRYVEVSMYQVARSLTIIWSIALAKYYLPDKKLSGPTILACLVVFSGFVIGSVGEVNLEIKGLIAGVISSFFVAYNNTLNKQLIPLVNKNPWRLLIYSNTISIFLFLPTIIADGSLYLIMFDPDFKAPEGIWTALSISGVLGILINVAISLQIKYTSALTGAISGTVKACAQTILGVLIFQNEITLLNGFGIFMVIAGSAWYSQIGYKEIKQEEEKKRQQSSVSQNV